MLVRHGISQMNGFRVEFGLIVPKDYAKLPTKSGASITITSYA